MARKGPLRMIRGEVWEKHPSYPMKQKLELLACGHTQTAPQDFNGEIPGFRRRCGDCAKGAPRQYTQDQIDEISKRFPQFQYVALRCVRCNEITFESKESAVALKVAAGDKHKCGRCRTWERARKKAGLPID